MVHSLIELANYIDGVILEYQANDKTARIGFGDVERMYEYKNGDWELVKEEN